MNIKNISIGLVVLVVLALGVTFPKGNSVVQQIVGGAGGAGPDSGADSYSYAGVRTELVGGRKGLITATTTPCTFKTPSATSTLLNATLTVTQGTTTDTTIWTLAKATTPFATTTKLGAWSLTGGLKGSMVASTTPAGASPTVDDSYLVFAPNTYLVWGIAGTVPADTSKLTGFCQAEFRTL